MSNRTGENEPGSFCVFVFQVKQVRSPQTDEVEVAIMGHSTEGTVVHGERDACPAEGYIHTTFTPHSAFTSLSVCPL